MKLFSTAVNSFGVFLLYDRQFSQKILNMYNDKVTFTYL